MRVESAKSDESEVWLTDLEIEDLRRATSS